MPGFVHDAHPATTQFSQDLVAGNTRPFRQEWRFRPNRQPHRRFWSSFRNGQGDRLEDGVDQRAGAGKSLIVFQSSRAIAGAGAVLEIEHQQFAQQCGPVYLNDVLEIFLDPRGPCQPSTLEAIALGVQTADHIQVAVA